jgi:hypothetical protein
MPGRERHELPALTEEEYSRENEQPARARLHDLCEGGMEFTLVGGVHHQDLPSDGTARFLQVENTAAAIAAVSQSSTGALSVRMHDKLAALVALGKHLGMFDQAPEVEAVSWP